jgi:hypothetical protein
MFTLSFQGTNLAMNSIDITVLAVVVGVLLLVFLLCACNKNEKIRQQASSLFPSAQQSNTTATARSRRHRSRPNGRSERSSNTAGGNSNVFIISVERTANNAPPPEYKWEELEPPPSYEDAMKIAGLQVTQSS